MNPIKLHAGNHPLKSFEHNGNHFIVAPESGTYEIEISIAGSDTAVRRVQTSSSRLEMVISVDGLSVLDGELASLSGRGYIVTGAVGWNLRVPGWKIDGKSAAKFGFKAVDASYSALADKGTSNVGVIGLAVFAEKERPRPVYAKNLRAMGSGVLRSSGISGQSLSCEATDRGATMDFSPDVGTEFGEKTDFETSTTTFDRGEHVGIWRAYYRTREWFKANGIAIPGEGGHLGNAFPGDEKGCKPPAGWGG